MATSSFHVISILHTTSCPIRLLTYKLVHRVKYYKCPRLVLLSHLSKSTTVLAVPEISLLVDTSRLEYLLRNINSHQELLSHRSKLLALLQNITGIHWTFTMAETTTHQDWEVIQVKEKSEIILSEKIINGTEQERK